MAKTPPPIKVRNCKVVASSDKPLILADNQFALVIQTDGEGIRSGKDNDGKSYIHAGAYGTLPNGQRITMNLMTSATTKTALTPDELAAVIAMRAK